MNICIRMMVFCIVLVTFPSLALAAKTHVIKKKDNLYSLAKKYHVSVQEIKSANNLVETHLKPGAKIVIPPRTVASSADRHSGSQKVKGNAYKVRKGDTMDRIAQKTGIAVSELKRLNRVHAKKLKPGSLIVLREAAPAENAPARESVRVVRTNTRLFSNAEYERTLAELTDADPEQTVDLSKNLELGTEASKKLKTTAFSFLGTRYRFGGNTRNGLDCSSFVQHVFRDLNINLPRTAREQYGTGEAVTTYDLQKGDLVFFRTYAPYPSHVGIYLGENKMIHASSRDRKVVISSMNTPYYRSRFIGAKRYSKINPETVNLNDLFADTEIVVEKDEDVLNNDALNLGLKN